MFYHQMMLIKVVHHMKNQILYVGCNYGELDEDLLVNRRGIIVEGDIYITGQLSASNIAGSRESVADNSIETRKYKDLSITYEKIALNSIFDKLFLTLYLLFFNFYFSLLKFKAIYGESRFVKI